MNTFSLYESWQALANKYTVSDIYLPQANLIFLLESPHVSELKYQAPVSGASGITMTRHLFGESYARYPLGILIKTNVLEHRNRPTLNRIGLMNVCNIPMQGTAYGSRDVVETHAELIRVLQGIRSANQKDVYPISLWNEVQSYLLDNLRDRLFQFVDRSMTFVPCGRFAQKFFRLAAVESPKWTVVHDVPHPSYNSWDRPQYRPVVEQVQRALGYSGES